MASSDRITSAATCFGCGVDVPNEPGLYYCAACVAEQTRDHDAEMRAFDAFHAFADNVAAHRHES